MTYSLPEAAKKIIKEMTAGGFQCYLVGGCVRDILLSHRPGDYDFVTDRHPEEIKEAALKAGWKVWEHDLSFGVVNIVVEGTSFEIATMRAETYGDDPHRPEEVVFINDLASDLARRDFTINAMAMDIEGHIYDPFGGQEDLQKKQIRCVGETFNRLLEDPLRLLRASRFAARTGFQVDPAIYQAAGREEIKSRFHKLSVERVRDELEKTLLSPQPGLGFEILLDMGVLEYTCTRKQAGKTEVVEVLPELCRLKSVEQNPRFHRYDVLEHTLITLDQVKPEITLRWAALLHDLAKGAPGVRTRNKKGEIADYGHARQGAELARKIMERLRVSNSAARRAAWLVRRHMDLNFAGEKSVIRWVKKRAREFSSREQFLEAVQQLILLAQADNLGRGMDEESSFLPEMSRMLQETAENMVLYPWELEVSGHFIAEELGIQGPQVGKVLEDLLVQVQSGELENSRELLREAVRKKAKRLKQPDP